MIAHADKGSPMTKPLLTLVELAPMSCKYPIAEAALPGEHGQHFFCDEPAAGAGKPYCAAHRQLAYVKTSAGMRVVESQAKLWHPRDMGDWSIAAE
jgi:hypothetical protein